jgi:hypothetical protein
MRRKLTALVALTTTACTSYHVQSGPTPSVIQAASGSCAPIRLILKGGGAFAEVYEPTIVGDSIVGMSAPASDSTRQRVAFAVADVDRVATNGFSVGRTVLALAAITLAALIIVGAAASSSTSSTSNSSCGSTALARPSITFVA